MTEDLLAYASLFLSKRVSEGGYLPATCSPSPQDAHPSFSKSRVETAIVGPLPPCRTHASGPSALARNGGRQG